MNKKTKVSIILSALAAIGVASSVMAGATYALFTSESKVNIAVTSGKVNVTATIDSLVAYSPTSIGDDNASSNLNNAATNNNDEHKFKNGGTASITNNSLILNNMTPGDKVTFNINIENNSNIAIKYRTKVTDETTSTESNLFSQLVIKIGDNLKITNETTSTNWAEVSPNVSINSLNCSVELPSSVADEYQDKSCTLSYTVEAIQANKATD